MKRNLARFNYERDTSHNNKTRLIAWWLIQNTIFTWFATPNGLRILCLRIFHASIGSGVIIRRGARVHFPWNLTVGDDTWIGEQVWIINHAPIIIGSNVCISQQAILSSGSHDIYSSTLQYKHSPIEIKDGVWLCLKSVILAGVTVGTNSVVSAGEVLRTSLPGESLYINNSVRTITYPYE